MTAPQLRHDPITGRPVLIAPERAARTGALLPPVVFPDDAAICPFCEGREERTPPEWAALRDHDSLPNTPGWRVRVVPNRYPAARGELGEHEIIVECPGHLPDVVTLGPAHLAEVLSMYRDRLRARRAEQRWIAAQLFKNHGPAAGASLSHAHSQLLVLNEMPRTLVEKAAAVVDKCAFCQLIASEIREKERIILDSPRFVAFAAVAGRFPFETWLLPKSHAKSFEDEKEFTELAAMLHELARRLDAAASRPAYNLVFHTAPWNGADFHWHIELLPRITGIAGFELGSGMFINPIVPEVAAARLGNH